jgi:hypothetical protein
MFVALTTPHGQRGAFMKALLTESAAQQGDAHLFRRPPNAVSLLLITLLAAAYFSPPADLDFTWQIRTGEHIVRTGQLRPVDTFSYTIAGQKVPDFEWLYEVGLYGVWSVFGHGGLKLLRILCVGLPLLLVGLRLRRENVPAHGIALSLATAVLVLAGSWNLRPLYCTTIGLLLVSGWLRDHCTGKRPLSWWLPVVMLLWANLHPGVITGQGLLLGAIGWEWLNRRIRLNTPLSRASCWRLTYIGGLGLAATLLSPDPLDRLLYPFRPGLNHPIMRGFLEMRPLHTVLATPPYTAFLVYVVGALVLLTLVLRFRQYRLWEVALLAGVALLGSYALRNTQDWLLVMLAVGVPHLAEVLRSANVAVLKRLDASCRELLDAPAFRFQWYWPAAALALLAVVSLVPQWGRAMPVREGAEWPVQAADWIEANGLHGRFFASPNDGAYLLWRMPERAQSYVDTRGFYFPPELLEDSHYLPQMGPNWQRHLEHVLAHGTEFFLLETSGQQGTLWQTLEPAVPNPLYRDERRVILSTEQLLGGLTTEAQRKEDRGSRIEDRE